jgi:hypothetical protein
MIPLLPSAFADSYRAPAGMFVSKYLVSSSNKWRVVPDGWGSNIDCAKTGEATRPAATAIAILLLIACS